MIIDFIRIMNFSIIKSCIFLLLLSSIYFCANAETKYTLIQSQIKSDCVKLYNPGDSIPFDTIPQMHNERYYFEAYNELFEMFDGSKRYNLLRAEYLLENAYFEGKANYNQLATSVNKTVENLKKFIVAQNIQGYKTAVNAALFHYFTKPNWMNGNKPFSYDYQDCAGNKDFSVFLTSKVIRTHSGQCTSLPIYYKILCDAAGGSCFLATAPNHMYIKHISEEGKWVNVELTTGSFARDEWYIQTMEVSTEAIKNGLFLTALSEKETIGYIIYMLAHAYLRKYRNYDYFVLLIGKRLLNSLPHFYPAMELVKGTCQQFGYDYVHQIGKMPSNFIEQTYRKHKSMIELESSLGFSTITDEKYFENVRNATEEIKQAKK
ncbi:hypothetical protein [Sodaliphilus sp.]|uniref:hypothetical protein n=1 Tax=Sodaliphilus sp. TaxID=2815818 RepID=UPI00388DEEBB